MPNSHKCFKKQPVRHSKLPWTHFLIGHLKKRERVSQTSAHRYLNGESDIHKYVYKDGNDERDINSIIKEIKQDLSKQSTNILLDDLRAKGIKLSPSKNLYQGSVAEVLAKQLNEIIKDAEKTSHNFSRIPKNSQSKDNKKIIKKRPIKL